MVVYIRKSQNPIEVSLTMYNLQVGAYLLGEEVVCYKSIHELPAITKNDLILDYLHETRAVLKLMAIEVGEIDYPDDLHAFYGRQIREGILGEIVNLPENWGQFVKPKVGGKSFTGRVVKGTHDLIGIGLPFDYPVWISEAVNFQREWRVFVLHGRVLDVRPYKGDYHYLYDATIIDQAIQAWKDAPVAYALDVGVTDTGATLIVEVNDGFALGDYGLNPIEAYRFREARWQELIAPYFTTHSELKIPDDYLVNL